VGFDPVAVTETAQIELRSGRVSAPAIAAAGVAVGVHARHHRAAGAAAVPAAAEALQVAVALQLIAAQVEV
jgi:hypothetical protein